MSAMLPPGKLLPATIVATAVALGIKALTLITLAPSPEALWAGATQALELVRTASVIGLARAAPIQAAPIQAAPIKTAAIPATGPGIPQSSVPQAPSSAIAAPTVPAASLPPASAPPTVPQLGATTGGGDVTQEIKLRRSQMEEREQRLTDREAELAATDKHLADRVAELITIQTRLETLENDRKAHEEANWAGLVKLYEGMRPRDAAAIFNGLDKPVLLEILDRMKAAKASPVIALMEPESARQITADLASKRTRSTTVMN
jgi:flagellar motility protein MotE (MotC chaperone)